MCFITSSCGRMIMWFARVSTAQVGAGSDDIVYSAPHTHTFTGRTKLEHDGSLVFYSARFRFNVVVQRTPFLFKFKYGAMR